MLCIGYLRASPGERGNVGRWRVHVVRRCRWKGMLHRQTSSMSKLTIIKHGSCFGWTKRGDIRIGILLPENTGPISSRLREAIMDRLA